MFASYLAGEGHEDSESGEVGAFARGVTLVYLYQETAVPGPVGTLLHAFPEDTKGLFAQRLHLKIEWAHGVLLRRDNYQSVSLCRGGEWGEPWLRSD